MKPKIDKTEIIMSFFAESHAAIDNKAKYEFSRQFSELKKGENSITLKTGYESEYHSHSIDATFYKDKIIINKYHYRACSNHEDCDEDFAFDHKNDYTLSISGTPEEPEMTGTCKGTSSKDGRPINEEERIKILDHLSSCIIHIQRNILLKQFENECIERMARNVQFDDKSLEEILLLPYMDNLEKSLGIALTRSEKYRLKNICLSYMQAINSQVVGDAIEKLKQALNQFDQDYGYNAAIRSCLKAARKNSIFKLEEKATAGSSGNSDVAGIPLSDDDEYIVIMNDEAIPVTEETAKLGVC